MFSELQRFRFTFNIGCTSTNTTQGTHSAVVTGSSVILDLPNSRRREFLSPILERFLINRSVLIIPLIPVFLPSQLAFCSLLDSSIYEPPLVIVKYIFGASPIVVRFDVDFVELNGIGLVTAINFLFLARFIYANPRSVAFHIAVYKKLEIDWAYQRSFAVIQRPPRAKDSMTRIWTSLLVCTNGLTAAQGARRVDSFSWERLQDHGRSCDVPRLGRQHKIAGVDTGFIVETTVR
ncbi:hypothetical protein EDD85DRAFT_963046 [Armillaria nabsnona]|nr:hypothetical protein EDD85DRAFT_963046 [Armillaria nabsnona]